MTDELPRLGAIPTRVQIDPRAIIAPAIPGTQDRAGLVVADPLRELGQSGLSAHAPAVNLVSEVGDVTPTSAAVGAGEDGEVARLMAPQGRCGNYGTRALEFDVARVGHAFVPGRGIDRVVHEETPWLRLVRGLRFVRGWRLRNYVLC